MRWFATALGLLLAVLPLGASPSQACANTSYLGAPQDWVDPAYERLHHYDYDTETCTWSTWWDSILCTVTPLAEAGSPTTVNGYREGIYAFTCNADGIGDARAYADVDAGTCVFVPYLAVLGTKIPGTDATYCGLALDERRPLSGPGQDAGIFVITQNIPTFTALGYFIFDLGANGYGSNCYVADEMNPEAAVVACI